MEALIREVAAFAGDLVRNIKGVRVSQDLFDDLGADAADRDVAIAAEGATRMPSASPLITRPFDYGAVITYPFVPHNWQATRYSDGLAYGVWYVLDDLLGRGLIAQILSVGGGIAAGGAVYAAVVLALRVPEARQIVDLFARRFRRNS